MTSYARTTASVNIVPNFNSGGGSSSSNANNNIHNTTNTTSSPSTSSSSAAAALTSVANTLSGQLHPLPQTLHQSLHQHQHQGQGHGHGHGHGQHGHAPTSHRRFKYIADLSQCLLRFLIPLLPTPEELAVKEDVRKLLERLIRNIEPNSQLLSFGSTANGFLLRNSGM